MTWESYKLKSNVAQMGTQTKLTIQSPRRHTHTQKRLANSKGKVQAANTYLLAWVFNRHQYNFYIDHPENIAQTFKLSKRNIFLPENTPKF